MNLLLAFVIFTGHRAVGRARRSACGSARSSSGAPAAASGLVAGDTIVTINGTRYSGVRQPGAGDRRPPGERPARPSIARDPSTPTAPPSDVAVVLRVADAGAAGRARDPGARPSSTVGTIDNTFVEAVQTGAKRTVQAFSLILVGLGDLARSIVTDPTAAPPASGPVGIAVELGNVLWGLGPLYVIYLTALLSANLALVNILPFPPLDGGRMLVIVLKAIPRYGRRISLRAEQLTYAVGFVALFTFLIWITVFDIAKQVSGTP